MKKIQYVLLFVFCVALVLIMDAQDINSIADLFTDLFTMHFVDYVFLAIWAGIFYLLLLFFAKLSHKLAYAVVKK